MAYSKKKENKEVPGIIKKEVEVQLENDLAITSIDFRKIEKGNLLAAVTLTINDCLVIRDCLLTENKGNRYFNFPQEAYQSGKETKYYDKVFPIVSGVRAKIQEAVIDNYKII